MSGGGSSSIKRIALCDTVSLAARIPKCAPRRLRSVLFCRIRDEIQGVVRTAYQVLYRKWRPKTFSDVVGQPQVTVTLQNELKAGRIAHAYLFTGSRGTGKTSCAKILAKAVNCLSLRDGDPCGECEICRGVESGAVMDIVEIDAASNNGVDNIRDLREEANFTPAMARYRVYIIDEVHMLSVGAFNALLKTLEEPPPHVLFILATTEVHKLPATILSRCQRFDFHRIPPALVADHLQYVCGQEHCAIERDAALLIARLSDGALRDAFSLLDQCMGRANPITQQTVTDTAGLTGRSHLVELAAAVAGKDCAAALSAVDRLHSASKDMVRLCEELISHFRSLMLLKTVRDPREMIVVPEEEYLQLEEQARGFTLPAVLHVLESLQGCQERMFQGGNRRVEMEMTLLRLCSPELDASAGAVIRRLEMLERAVKSGGAARTAPEPQVSEQHVSQPHPKIPEAREPGDGAVETVAAAASGPESPVLPRRDGVVGLDCWPEVLEALHQMSPSLASFLNDSRAYISGDYVLIDAPNSMAFELLRKSPQQKDRMREAIKQITGRLYRLGPYKKEESGSAQQQEDPLAQLMAKAEQAGIEIIQ